MASPVALPLEPVGPLPQGGVGQDQPRGASDGHRGSLSPSRAADFMACPLKYRFRVVDKLPEPPSPAAVRGTLVHAVLEELFTLPAELRSPERAVELLAPAWTQLQERTPELAQLFPAPVPDADAPAPAADEAEQRWLAEAERLVRTYFTLEDPMRLAPAATEEYVEAVLPDGLRLRGYVDRLDRNGAGDLRVVDYKTGRSPSELFEGRALFQMKFYALVLWRARGVIPRELRLVYLGDGSLLRYAPDESDLRATERKVLALWSAIERAHVTGDWRPTKGPLCGYCAHQALCPVFGGTPPPLPAAVPSDVEVVSPAAALGDPVDA
jgi:putative RecB family exonuclease